MTDTENEAVAKALDLKIGSLFQGDTRVLIVKELSDAAIAALDAHRATVPHVVTTARGLSDLPEGTVLRDRDGWLYEVGEDRWFLLGGDPYNKCSQPLVMLPATVLTPAPEPTERPALDIGEVHEAALAVQDYERARRDGTTLDVAPEPTVKPDRETLATAVQEALIGSWSDEYEYAEAPGAVADAILALWQGKTEREVAEAAWDEAFKAGVDYMYCEREDYDGFGGAMPPPNPYRAKGAGE